jgi:hypothetical protein
MEVKNDNYKIAYNPESGIIACSGNIELRGKEGYADIAKLLKNVVESKVQLIILDMRKLEFLNTMGITTLGGFIIDVRNKGNTGLKIRISRQYPWQGKALKGLEILMENMEVEVK